MKKQGNKPKAAAAAAAASSSSNDIDERFAPLLKDAKFRPSTKSAGAAFKPKATGAGAASSNKPGKREASKKIVVDDRFKSMFEDEEFQSKTVLDKYGRKPKAQSKSESFKDITRHYTLDKYDESRLEELNQLARGLKDDGNSSSSSDGGSSADEGKDGSDSDDDDEEDDADLAAQVHFDSDEITKLELGQDTSARLAIVGCDWDRVRAVDLLAILNSFVPAVGAILRVSIYPTKFGLERMQMEEENGPMSNTAQVIEDDLDDEDGETNVMGSKYNPELLRKYEKERLLYCVAVVECDSKETAEVVYKECDGLEFEHSSIALDLRFIPDDVVFNAEQLRDSADEVPDEYQGPEDFVNKSLQQTSVSLSWDDAKHDRAKLHEWGSDLSQKKKKTAGVSMEELEAFIASSDDDSDEEEEQRAIAVQKYRALLLSGPGEEDDAAAAGADEEDEDAEYVPNAAKPKEKKPSAKTASKKVNVNEVEDVKPATKKTKGKNKKRDAAEGEEAEVQLDVEDERLAGLFTEPEFMLDQTDPRYKPTATTKKINEERRKRIKIRD